MASYTTKQLADMAGVTERTLRHYDAIGLLCPRRSENGYRRYGGDEVDRLQRILLLRDAGMPLARIAELIDAPGFEPMALLREQLARLREQRTGIDRTIETVERTIRSLEGEDMMSDTEKFEGLKRSLVERNERTYGAEVRERFGDEAADASNAKFLGMTEERYEQVKALEKKIAACLSVAMDTCDPTSAEARAVCELHAEWLKAFWKDGTYSREAHAALAETYVTDERFRAYYEAFRPGAAQFLRDAIIAWAVK
jgi:DNA-binding transcriptional MerR regulator